MQSSRPGTAVRHSLFESYQELLTAVVDEYGPEWLHQPFSESPNTQQYQEAWDAIRKFIYNTYVFFVF